MKQAGCWGIAPPKGQRTIGLACCLFRALGTLKPENALVEIPSLVLENRHTGERLVLRRVKRGEEVWLELRGTLPPHRGGPPLHIHLEEHEEGQVIAGTLGAVVDGKEITVSAGGPVVLPRGSVHRWWNAGEDTLQFDGYARPAVDLDRFLQATFEVLNAGPEDRPPVFYMAHLVRRHRHTQVALVIPRPIQALLFPIVVAIGTVLRRYRGNDWPGCPARCPGAPLV
jgi:mannose-6-phosphate isomerase-like protein (cupin superfamily)